MEFKKYNEIENSYRQKFIDNINEQGYGGDDWIVSEKVHGANFSFLYNGNELKVASRSAIVDGNFYNCQSVIDKYKNKVINLFNELNEKQHISSIQIYGELCGGNYPNIKSNVKSIQKGVFYTPELEFYAFDIRINNLQYLDVYNAQYLFKNHNFFFAETLFTGTLEQCLKYPNNYNSTISKKLNLPDVENNICEGNVIKPIKTCFLNNKHRVIIKNKNDKFSEKTKIKKSRPEIKLTNEGNNILDKLRELNTENRLHNILSKEEKITTKDFGKLLGLMSKDMFEEFNKDFSEEINNLGKQEIKKIKSILNKEIGNIIRKNFLNIIDGLF